MTSRADRLGGWAVTKGSRRAVKPTVPAQPPCDGPPRWSGTQARPLRCLVAPDADRRNEPRPGRRGGRYDFARRVLASDWGKQLYLKRQGSVEPVFGQIKSNRGADRFQRRGRSAVRSEWRLLTATHNLLKLHRHQLAIT